MAFTIEMKMISNMAYCSTRKLFKKKQQQQQKQQKSHVARRLRLVQSVIYSLLKHNYALKFRVGMQLISSI